MKAILDIAIIYFTLGIMIPIFFAVFPRPETHTVYTLSISLAFTIFVIATAFSIAKLRGDSITYFFGQFKGNKRNKIGIFALIAVAISLIVAAIFKGNQIDVNLTLIIFFFISIEEEFIFRGYIHQKLIDIFSDTKKDLVLVVVIQSLLFMSLHIFANLSKGLPIFILIIQFTFGVMITLIRIWGRNLSLPIAFHWVINAMSVLFK